MDQPIFQVSTKFLGVVIDISPVATAREKCFLLFPYLVNAIFMDNLEAQLDNAASKPKKNCAEK